MFTTVRFFIKTSIIFLVVGILTGLFISITKNIFGMGFNPEMVSAHTHVILIGSVMMMIMGVALWFFPRAEKNDKKYNPGIILLSYWMMTLSTALRFISQIAASFIFSGLLFALITVFSVFQVAAVILFFYSIWGRIRSVGSKIREERGEKF